MRMKTTGGRIVHSPLSCAFSMIELGGSGVQKYNTLNQSYIPNRELTPLVFKPQLTITDPDGVMPSGDYTAFLVNVSFRATMFNNTNGNSTPLSLPYDSSTKALTVNLNILPGNTIKVEFSADYHDKRRDEVMHFEWTKNLSSVAEVLQNLKMKIAAPTKMNLSPFKNRGKFDIQAQLYNGEDPVPDANAVYLWLYLNDSGQWDLIRSEECPWYVSGANSKSIRVDQDYIQKVNLKCTGHLALTGSRHADSKAILLRRWYGMWDEHIDFAEGKYIFHDTNRLTIEAKVVNRQGNIKDPQKYFDMEIFFMNGAGAKPESVGYGEGATIYRDHISPGHKVGVLCRQLTAWLPIELPNGALLADPDGKVLMVQVPTSKREVD